MNDQEQTSFESDLRRLKPSRPPEIFLDRLERALPRQGRASRRVGIPDRAASPPSLIQSGRARCPDRAERSHAGIPSGQSWGERFSWWRRWRWVAPAGMVGGALVALLVWRHPGPEPEQSLEQGKPAPVPLVTADDVAIGQHLLASYDAVVELPGGQPVRFRCREWMDEVVWRDSARGLVVEQQTPRLEVTPVGLEVY